MPATVITLIDCTARFALGATEPPDWSAATGVEDFTCQVTAAEVVPTANVQDVPATMCQGASQVPAASSFALRLAGLQDVTDAAGLSMFLYDHDAAEAWVQVVGPTQVAGAAQVEVTAHVNLLAGAMLGDAGTPLTFEVSLACREKPAVAQLTAP